MMQHVNKVFVGQATTATAVDGMNINDIAVFDKDGKIATAGTAVTGESFKVGKCVGVETITMPDGSLQNKKMVIYGNEINPFIVTNQIQATPFKAPVEDIIDIDFTGVVITTGFRYVVRIYYRDIYELKSMFTNSYEVIATSADTNVTIANRLADRINMHAGRRVNATVAGTTITLTAMPKTNNEGVNSINLFTQVSMEVSAYATDPRNFFAGQVKLPIGATITRVQTHDPGNGFWKVVRDRENLARPYRGSTNVTWFPVIRPELAVDPTKEYATIVIEYENSFASADNQYRKNTLLADELYIDMNSGYTAILNTIKKFLGL